MSSGAASLEERAEALIEKALDGVRNGEGDEVLFALTLAVEVWRAVMGDARALEEVEEAFREPVCICPPDLVARGGFRGGCLVHG